MSPPSQVDSPPDSAGEAVVKERPAQTDIRYRPGTLPFATTKLGTSDSDQGNEKSPFEKMLEDESERESKRRQMSQARDFGFVLGTPTNESDGTILFNYDEPPARSFSEEEYRNQTYSIDSDSTLNNTLRRAIREQQEQEVNKRFMESGSSGSSLETVGSTGEAEEHDAVEPSLPKPQTKTEPSIFEPRTEEVHVTKTIVDESLTLPSTATECTVQVQTEQNQGMPSSQESGHNVPIPYCSGTVKKKGFFRRFFSSKKQNNS
ncbi:uncharacterized protein LOC142326934 [Lycorma delicatula]|uniref:uncharacterized protein LOC142326934 n=1 Tax=Lycorma delicatula TaxID=130591 RepID=UPI003F515C60